MQLSERATSTGQGMQVLHSKGYILQDGSRVKSAANSPRCTAACRIAARPSVEFLEIKRCGFLSPVGLDCWAIRS